MPVQLPPPAPKERSVGSILYKAVLKDERRVRWVAAAEDEARGDKLVQRIGQLSFVAAGDRC